MKKKYIEVNGKKYYEAEEKNAETQEQDPVEETPEEGDDKGLDPELKKEIQNIGTEIGNSVKKALEAVVPQQQPGDNPTISSKMSELLKGKDLKDKDALTAEEKIVAFYHALISGDKAVCKALSEGTAADGGYLFPDEFRAELIKSLIGPFTMRGLVRVIPMRRDIMKIPSLGSRPKVTWTAENETKSTTTADFDEITLTAKKCAAILYSSDELIEDSTEIDVVRLIIDLFADAYRDEEDKVILQGNGTTQPTGLLTAVTATTIASRTCAGNLDTDDMIDTYYDLPQRYRGNAKWIVATANLRELRKMKDSNGQYLWQPAVSADQPATFLGKPVIENDYVGEATILFGDFKLGYWLGDRKQMTVKISQDTETAFTKDQTAIRVVERIAGNVIDAKAIRALVTIP